MKCHRLFWLVLVLFMAESQKFAMAAPQILAVLSTEGAVPLNCSDGFCEAELSTYCLQRHRSTPGFGQAYRPGNSQDFTLVVTTADGDRRRISAAPYLSFVQARGYTSALVRIPVSALAAIGGVGASIEVGANASLVPVPQPGDADPLTAAEIAHATGPLRALGAQIVDDGGTDSGAARLVAKLVNALPKDRQTGTAESAAAWHSAAGSDRGAGAAGPALDVARAAYDGCVGAVAGHGAFSLRGCLEARHDSLMRDLNDSYWNAGAGS